MTAKEYDIKGFDRVRLVGPFDFDIVPDQHFHINISQSRFQKVLGVREGDTLNIRLALRYSILGLMAGRRSQVQISLPELREVQVAGSSRGNIGNFNTTHDFNLSLAGASQVNLGNITAGDVTNNIVGSSQLNIKRLVGNKMEINIVGASRLEGELQLKSDLQLKITGASKLEASGRAANLYLNMAGASQASLANLSVQNARVRLVRGSRAVVNPAGQLDADLVGASSLNWLGNPTMGNIHSVGTSTMGKV
jgi:hypothetical protein